MSVAGGDNCVKATAFESKGSFTQKRGKATRACVDHPPPPAFNDEVINEKHYYSTPHLFLEDMSCEGTSLSSLLGFLEIPNINVCYYSSECLNNTVTSLQATFSVL
jgi:hypothetical protein